MGDAEGTEKGGRGRSLNLGVKKKVQEEGVRVGDFTGALIMPGSGAAVEGIGDQWT